MARRRARRESVSKDRSFLGFISSGIAEHGADFYGNKERMIVTFASLDYKISELAWVASLYTYLAC